VEKVDTFIHMSANGIENEEKMICGGPRNFPTPIDSR
jgi:hypothetical protein